MFYEEKLIDGKLYCRTTPDGEWRLKSVDQSALIRELVVALERLERAATQAASAMTPGEEQIGLIGLIAPAVAARVALAKVLREYRG